MCPFLSPPDTIIAQLTLSGRNLLAREKTGDVTFRALGWQLGRDGYQDLNPVKVEPIVDTATEAVGYIEVIDNTFQSGDSIVLNGKSYIYNVDWFPGANIPSTVQNIIEKVRDTMDGAHYRLVYPDVDPLNSNKIRFTSLITGSIGNSFPISAVEVPGHPNFSVTPMSGGTDFTLGDPAYPTPPILGQFLSLEGDTETPSATSISFLMRVPEGPVGLNAYGEVGIWVKVLDSNFDPEIGRKVLYAIGHFPIQAKSDRHIYVQRIIINY